MKAMRNTWSPLSKVPINIRNWRTKQEGQVLLRELGGRRAMFEPGSLGQIELCSQRRQRKGWSSRDLMAGVEL